MRQSGADLAEEERPYGQYQTATHPPPTSPSTRSSTTPQLPAPDDAVTRSAEHLTVGTEQVSQTVPDSHEVTIERGPITDSNINDAMDEPASSEEEHEAVLSEERPLVQMVAVPVTGCGSVTRQPKQAEVTGQVRKQQIGLDDETASRLTPASKHGGSAAVRAAATSCRTVATGGAAMRCPQQLCWRLRRCARTSCRERGAERPVTGQACCSRPLRGCLAVHLCHRCPL